MQALARPDVTDANSSGDAGKRPSGRPRLSWIQAARSGGGRRETPQPAATCGTPTPHSMSSGTPLCRRGCPGVPGIEPWALYHTTRYVYGPGCSAGSRVRPAATHDPANRHFPSMPAPMATCKLHCFALPSSQPLATLQRANTPHCATARAPQPGAMILAPCAKAPGSKSRSSPVGRDARLSRFPHIGCIIPTANKDPQTCTYPRRDSNPQSPP